MFERFLLKFDEISKTNEIVLNEKHKEILYKSIGAIDFIRNFEGHSFNNGLYRIHKVSELDKWNQIVYEAFPSFANKVFCFSYDWLGRHFALDFRRLSEEEPMILMLEPGTGEALEIPSTFLNFHEEELVEYQDAALAIEFFYEWNQENASPLEHNFCVGYKVPLFLGGEDEVSNLEITDMEVYWSLMGQLLKQSL